MVIQNHDCIEATRGKLYKTSCPNCGCIHVACGLTFGTLCRNCYVSFGLCRWCKFLNKSGSGCDRNRITGDNDRCTGDHLLIESRLEMSPELPTLEES